MATCITLEAAIALADKNGWPLPNLTILARHIDEYNLTMKDPQWFGEKAARSRGIGIQTHFLEYFEKHHADITNLEATPNLSDVDRHLMCISELQSSIIVNELERHDVPSPLR